MDEARYGKRVLLTTAQVVDRTGLARNTVLDAAADGRLPAYKLLGTWRYPSDLLDAWMEERFNQSRTTEPGRVQAEPSRPSPRTDHQRGAGRPPESTPPLVVLFPNAAHRGIYDELPAETPAQRPTVGRRSRTRKGAASAH